MVSIQGNTSNLMVDDHKISSSSSESLRCYRRLIRIFYHYFRIVIRYPVHYPRGFVCEMWNEPGKFDISKDLSDEKRTFAYEMFERYMWKMAYWLCENFGSNLANKMVLIL